MGMEYLYIIAKTILFQEPWQIILTQELKYKNLYLTS